MDRRKARKEALRIVSGRIGAITGGDVTKHLKKGDFEGTADQTATVIVEVARIKNHLDWELAGRPKR